MSSLSDRTRGTTAALPSLLAPALALALGACDGGDAPPDGAVSDAGVDAGPSCTELTWDPASGSLDRWPEPDLLVDDATTETGVRLAFDPAAYPSLGATLRGYLPVFEEDLAELDGFGVNAEAFFTFGRAFDASALPATTEDPSALGLVVLEPRELRPALVSTTDEDRTVLLAPMRPLPARATVAAYVTRGATEAAGGCLEPSPAMRAALDEPDPDATAAIEALVDQGVIGSADELVALTVYPTQSIEGDSLAVADDVDARDAPGFVEPPTCVTEAAWVRCEARVSLNDYRDGDGVFRRAAGEAAAPVASYEVPLTFWLPLDGEPPYPTLFFGHGLTGDRNQARRLAEFAAPEGLATVAAPALMHGEHPTNPDPDGGALNVVLGFFAVGDLSERALHAAKLRDHFRQTTWDRLQITRLLEGGPDVDGDGTSDVDPGALLYLGVSLGGLMGPELLATTDRYGAGVLVVPGGRVSAIIRDSSLFSSLIDLLRPRTASPGDVRRFFPILQTVLDAGDPASYGAHGLRDRFARAPAVPSVLLGVVLDDDTVPSSSNYALGRAYGVPIVEPVRREEVGFASVPGPLSGNFADGAATGGLLQFDLVRDDGEVVPATHDNVGDSEVGAAAWFDFLTTHLDGLARIRDPYAAVDFPR